jgi:hypothetical protein
MDAFDNDFYGNFRIFVDNSWQNITTFFATAAGLQAEVTNRTNADQTLANGYSQLKMSWNKISQSVFSLVNVANKETFIQSDTSTEWASDMNGNATVFNGTFSTYRPVEIVTSFDYDYTNYPSQGGQAILVYGFINGSSTRSFEVAVAIGSDGQATVQKNIGGANVDADVTVDETTGHVNVFVRNSGNEITAAEVHISPRWGVITIENIMVADTDESHSFKRTGIDVMQGVINLIADKVNFLMPDGSANAKVSIDPVNGTLLTKDAILKGNLFLPYLRLTSSNISQYQTTNFAGQTVINLSAAGNNIQVEVSNVTIRLPKITEDMLGCEINIFNATTSTIEINGSGQNGSTASGAYFCNLLVPSQAMALSQPSLRTNSQVYIQGFREAKFKAIFNGETSSEAFNYTWLCCYANANP